MSGATQFSSFKPTERTEPKTQFIRQAFSSQKIAYLVDTVIRSFQLPTYTLMGTEELKLVLHQMRLSAAGDEVLILLRLFIHSMAVYLRVLPNKKITGANCAF